MFSYQGLAPRGYRMPSLRDYQLSDATMSKLRKAHSFWLELNSHNNSVSVIQGWGEWDSLGYPLTLVTLSLCNAVSKFGNYCVGLEAVNPIRRNSGSQLLNAI